MSRRFDSATFHTNERSEFFDILIHEKYPPQGGIGEARLTIDDPS